MYETTFLFFFHHSNDNSDPQCNALLEPTPAQILRHARFGLIYFFQCCTRSDVVLSLSCLTPLSLFLYIFSVVTYVWFSSVTMLISLPRMVFLRLQAWDNFCLFKTSSNTSSRSPFLTHGTPDLRVDTTLLGSFFFKVYLFRERQRKREWEEGRERRRQRIPSRLHAASTDPNTGLELSKP